MAGFFLLCGTPCPPCLCGKAFASIDGGVLYHRGTKSTEEHRDLNLY